MAYDNEGLEAMVIGNPQSHNLMPEFEKVQLNDDALHVKSAIKIDIEDV